MRILILLIACAFLAGCLTPKPKLTTRYSSREIKTENIDGANFSVFVMRVPSVINNTSILDLTERAQAALVTSLNSKSESAKELLEALGEPIEGPQQDSPFIDRTVFKRRLVCSVENLSKEPATRLAATKIVIKDLSGIASFKNWDKFVTKFETIDLGALKLTQENEFSVGGAIKVPRVKELTPIDLSRTDTRTLEEAITLSQRYVTATGSLSTKQAELIQQGVAGIDLTGNIAVDIEIQLTPSARRPVLHIFRGLKDDKGAYNPPDKIKFSTQVVLLPEEQTAITFKAQLQYVLRQVKKGDKTITEGDDDASYTHATKELPGTVTLLSARELQFYDWMLQSLDREILHISKSATGCGPIGANAEPIKFSSVEAAHNFLAWLAGTNFKVRGQDVYRVGERQLCYRGNPLTAADLDKLQVEFIEEK